MHLADSFIQNDLQSMCVAWELNPQSFVLLTKCSTTEPLFNRLSCISALGAGVAGLLTADMRTALWQAYERSLCQTVL